MFRVKKLEEIFINEYVLQEEAILRRIKEQAVTSFVKKRGNCVFLTQKGINFLKIAEFIKIVYGLKKFDVASFSKN